MSPIPARRHPRTQLYLPSRCTALLPRDRTITLEGKTDTVGRGGLRLLLPTLLKAPTPVTVSLAGEDALKARVVWVGPTRRTNLGTVVPHGLRFIEEISAFTFADLLAALREKAQVQRNPRLPVRLGIQVMLGETFQPATTLNLSLAGAFITTPTPLPDGEEILLHLTLPGTRRPLYLSGQVVWQNSVRSSNGFQPGMGVAFSPLGAEETTALQHFLRHAPAR
ncbi:MAG: PilZ domain-containing protein [candidate division NC10 bacterium]|nr:PilZ domain-containing protein [candidate division NC10 bacterium]